MAKVDTKEGRAALVRELRELIPQMREDAEHHRSWETAVAQNDLEPGSAYLREKKPVDLVGDAAWHERWAKFYDRAAEVMGTAADALEALTEEGL